MLDGLVLALAIKIIHELCTLIYETLEVAQAVSGANVVDELLPRLELLLILLPADRLPHFIRVVEGFAESVARLGELVPRRFELQEILVGNGDEACDEPIILAPLR